MNRMRNYFGGNQNGSGNLPGPFGNMMGMVQKFNQFMQNPMAALMSGGLSVPQNLNNNPEAIVNYLRSSGQMSDDQFNQLSQMANTFQNFIPHN